MIAVTGTLSSGTVGFSLVPYLSEDAGIAKGQAAAVLSLATFLSITNLGWGYLADLVTPRRCLVMVMGVSGASVLYLIEVSSMPMALAFALSFGIASGPATPLENMILAQYFGRNSYGTIAGIYTPFQTAMLGLGPAFGSVFREVVGSDSILYVILGGLHFTSALFAFLARPLGLPARASAEGVARSD